MLLTEWRIFDVCSRYGITAEYVLKNPMIKCFDVYIKIGDEIGVISIPDHLTSAFDLANFIVAEYNKIIESEQSETRSLKEMMENAMKERKQFKNDIRDRMESLKTGLAEMFNVDMEYQTAISVRNALKITLTYREHRASFIINHCDIHDHLDDTIGNYVAELVMTSVKEYSCQN